MICIPITATSTESALADMQAASEWADLLELRVDYIRQPDLPRLLHARTRPVIVTITPQAENGKFAGTDEERRHLLEQAVSLGADYIDCNFGWHALPELIGNKQRTRVIVSSHNYAETPQDLQSIYNDIAATGADVVKIATYADRLSDSLRMLELVKSADRDIIGICMGPKGEVSRVLGPLYGSLLTFASLSAGKESAPGQIPADVMKTVYRVPGQPPDVRLFGLVGNPVDKSKGYLLFNRLFQHHGLNNIYLNFLADDLADFMSGFGRLLGGFSITMPHKQDIMPYLDEIDPPAAKIGAVNTVVNRNGRLWGGNTDLAGVVRPILQRTPLAGKRVTLLGAGGAARAAAVGIMDQGADLTILNRTVAKADRLAADLGCAGGGLEAFSPAETDVLVNMTAVGMHPRTDEGPVPTGQLHDMVVFDGIYNPPETLLLKKARAAGCTGISGLEMFVNQAAEQFRLWTGIDPDLRQMEEIVA